MSQLRTVIIYEFGLTDDDLKATTRSGTPLLTYQLGWAVAYLGQSGLVRRSRRGTLQITARGQEFLTRHPDRVDRDVLQFEESAQWYEFRTFVLQVLHRTWEAEPKAVVGLGYQTMTGDQGADLVLDRRGQTVLVNVKLQTPQTSARLLSVAKELVIQGAEYKRFHPDEGEPALLVAFPGVLSAARTSLLSGDRLEIWDGAQLRAEAYEHGVDVPPFVAYEVDASAFRSADHEADGGSARIDVLRIERFPFYEGPVNLLDRLSGITPGNAEWRNYEDYCEELLNFLFVPPLSRAISQSRNQNSVNRRDFILPNYAPDGFWRFMRDHYDADYVVAEVKNLRKRPSKTEVLQVANYLSPHGTGLFALILSRRSLDEAGKWICREQWAQHGKMIVGLDDDDVRQMITSKLAGGEPADMIRQKIEDFRLLI
jgi:hypothetical protein